MQGLNRKLDIHDGRAFAIGCIFVCLVALACYGRIDAEYVKYLATTAMGFLFGQSRGGKGAGNV